MHCDMIAQIFNYGLSIFLFIFLLIVLLSFLKYLQNIDIKNEDKVIWLHRVVKLFYILTVIYLLTSIPILIFDDCTATASRRLSMLIMIEISHFGYCGHWLFMVCILFLRLYYIFKDTVYRLSKPAINTFKIVMIIIFICIPITLYFKSITQTPFNLFGIIFILSIWFLSIYTVSFFIYKLRQLNISMTNVINSQQHANNTNYINKENAELLSTITKCSILTSFSIPVTLLFCTLVIISAIKHNNYESLAIITKYITVTDVFVNFLCIILSFKFNNSYYMKICRKCHVQCRIWCENNTKNNMQKNHSNDTTEIAEKEEVNDDSLNHENNNNQKKIDIIVPVTDNNNNNNDNNKNNMDKNIITNNSETQIQPKVQETTIKCTDINITKNQPISIDQQ